MRVLFLFRGPGVGLRHGFDQRPTAGEPGDGEAGEVGGCLSTCWEPRDWQSRESALAILHPPRSTESIFGKFPKNDLCWYLGQE